MLYNTDHTKEKETNECSCIALLIGIQWKNIMGNSKTMEKIPLKKRQVMLWSILEEKWVIQLLVRTEWVSFLVTI